MFCLIGLQSSQDRSYTGPDLLHMLSLQEQVISWALGSQHSSFATAAVFAPSTNTFHAVVQQSSQGSSSNFLLSWSANAQHGSLEQLAKRESVSGSVHSLHPLPAATSTTEQEPGSSISVAVVYSNGGVTLGAQDDASTAQRPHGSRVVHASAYGSLLAVICHAASATHQHTVEVYDLQVSLRMHAAMVQYACRST